MCVCVRVCPRFPNPWFTIGSLCHCTTSSRGSFFVFDSEELLPRKEARIWATQSFHYDNVATAMLTLFAVQTGEGWPQWDSQFPILLYLICLAFPYLRLIDSPSPPGSCKTRWRPPTKTRVQFRISESRCPSFISCTLSCFRSSSSTSSWPWSSSHSKSRARPNCRTVKSTRTRYDHRVPHLRVVAFESHPRRIGTKPPILTPDLKYSNMFLRLRRNLASILQ